MFLSIVLTGQLERGAKLEGDEDDWIGRTVLLQMLSGMFADADTKLPLRNALDNETHTLLRDALLVGLSQLQSRAGQTPPVVVKHLLSFFDNNDNSAEEDRHGMGAPSLDDSRYKALLLNCLSRIRFFSAMKNAKRIVRKIIDSARLLLEAEQSNAWTLYRLSKAASPSLPAGGILSAAALSCVAELEVQELLAGLVDLNAYFRSPPKPYVDYRYYFTASASAVTPPLVRSAALEAFVRVMWCKELVHRRHRGEPASDPPGSAGRGEYAAAAIDAVCSVIATDCNATVRRDAATSLLFVAQYRPPRVAVSGACLGEPLLALEAPDPGAYCDTYRLGRLFKVYKDVMDGSAGASAAFTASLWRLWGLIASGAAHDQVE